MADLTIYLGGLQGTQPAVLIFTHNHTFLFSAGGKQEWGDNKKETRGREE